MPKAFAMCHSCDCRKVVYRGSLWCCAASAHSVVVERTAGHVGKR